MNKQAKNYHPIMMEINNMMIDLPSPSSISYMWNWGSMLGVILILQLITGILLACHYTPNAESAFSSIIHLMKDVNFGWLLRSFHSNGASMFFIIIYIHIARGMLFSSYKSLFVWMSGTMILFILMSTAFLGYVLPWGQMSFWGATVITNLISALPYVGNQIVTWLWGGFSVSTVSLNRFFVLHFLMPFILTGLVIIHLMSLHIQGSNNPLGMNSNLDKIPFHNYFSLKDTLSTLVMLMMLLTLSLVFMYQFSEPENFTPANPLVTPMHIQPEWYFLFAYAILRSIPNKLGGVLALVLSILMIILLPIKSKSFLSTKLSSNKFFFWIYSSTFITLTWIGANPVEYPFEMLGQIMSIIYFSSMLSL